MPPASAPNPPAPAPSNNPYGFILNDKPKPKRSLIPHLPKPVWIGAGVLLFFIAIIGLSSLSSGQKSKYRQVEDVMAAQQEIIRIDSLVPTLSPDPAAAGLAATTSASMLSSQNELGRYLLKNKFKTSSKVLASRADKNTDASLKTAAANNSFAAAYYGWLLSSLRKYNDQLKSVYSTLGPNGQAILTKAEQSNAVLQSAPQLAITPQ